MFDPWRLASAETLMWLEMRGGLDLWRGRYEGQEAEWLRWCHADGTLIPTGAERAESGKQRAESGKQRAESEKQRAESEKQRADRLAAKLRELGVDMADD